MRKLRLAITVVTSVTALLVGIGVADGKAHPASTVTTPGAVRVVQNDQWVYFDELAEGEGFVEVSTEPGAAWLEKTQRGWKIHVTWGWTTHTFVDVQYNRTDNTGG